MRFRTFANSDGLLFGLIRLREIFDFCYNPFDLIHVLCTHNSLFCVGNLCNFLLLKYCQKLHFFIKLATFFCENLAIALC